MRSFLLSAITLFIFISCQPQQDQTAEVVNPAEYGFNTEQLQQVDSVFVNEIREDDIAGGVALIAKNGNVVFEEAWGWKDIEDDIPMQTHHLFRIASMTKAVTSVAILQLYENGQLSMDDPVSSYIPGFENPEVLTEFYPETGEYVSRPADTEITIHHLLTHTSGIAYGFSDEVFGQIYANHDIPDLGTEENKTIGETVNALAELPIMHDPGESFTYGLNTDVLGRIVEIVSEMPLNEYFRENIFDPLGMNDTGFYLPGREDDLTTLYTNPDDEFQPYPVNPSGGVSPNFPVQGAMTYYSGGAGLTSTARDYYTFLQALLNGGTYSGYELLENDTWQLMTSNQIGGLDLEGNKFGYGLMITTEEGAEDGMRPPGSLSWGGAFQTTYWIDQANEMIVVMMTQVVPSPSREEFYDDFERAVYNALETAE